MISGVKEARIRVGSEAVRVGAVESRAVGAGSVVPGALEAVAKDRRRIRAVETGTVVGSGTVAEAEENQDHKNFYATK